MKAIQIDRFGAPSELNLVEIKRPEPQKGEVLVRIRGAGINPIDWKTRSGGGLAHRLQDDLPVILGWDIAGEIESLGTDVTGFQVGEAVYSLARFPLEGGAYAQYTAVPAAEIAHKPQAMNFLEAAAMPLVALTAWQALFDVAQLQEKQRILIHAAAGGVGHIAIQLAKWRGAFVIGTASARNQAFLKELGADEAIDYQTVRFEEVAKDVDVVLDGVAGETRDRSWQVLKPGGILVSLTGAPDEAMAVAHNVRATRMLVHPDSVQLAQIATLVDQGHLSVHLDRVFPLADAQKAHELSEQGHTRGKIVLQVD